MRSIQVGRRLKALEGLNHEGITLPPIIVCPDQAGGYIVQSWPYKGQRLTEEQIEAWPSSVIIDDLEGGAMIKSESEGMNHETSENQL